MCIHFHFKKTPQSSFTTIVHYTTAKFPDENKRNFRGVYKVERFLLNRQLLFLSCTNNFKLLSRFLSSCGGVVDLMTTPFPCSLLIFAKMSF